MHGHGKTAHRNQGAYSTGNNDSTGYAVYEADSACKEAEFDVTVSNSDKWKITDKGQTG